MGRCHAQLDEGSNVSWIYLELPRGPEKALAPKVPNKRRIPYASFLLSEQRFVKGHTSIHHITMTNYT